MAIKLREAGIDNFRVIEKQPELVWWGYSCGLRAFDLCLCIYKLNQHMLHNTFLSFTQGWRLVLQSVPGRAVRRVVFPLPVLLLPEPQLD